VESAQARFAAPLSTKRGSAPGHHRQTCEAPGFVLTASFFSGNLCPWKGRGIIRKPQKKRRILCRGNIERNLTRPTLAVGTRQSPTLMEAGEGIIVAEHERPHQGVVLTIIGAGRRLQQ
jgi:hypothetical protein